MKTIAYGSMHFAVDFCCALLLFRSFAGGNDWMLALLLYNFCAFALQLPFGILADRLNRNSLVAASGMALTAAAFLFPRAIIISVMMAGCGNALFHIGGGIEILNQSTRKALRLGGFVAPGALGLFLGSQLGKGTIPAWPFPLFLLLSAVVLLISDHSPSGNTPPRLPRIPWGLLALFGVVVLRSYLGFCMVFSWNNNFGTAFLLILATVLGKVTGGLMLDRFGYLPTACCSLFAAAGLLLQPNWIATSLLGVFCFQMTMPVTLWVAARCCPDAKGFSFGLLTFALFLGFLPILFGLRLPANSLLLTAGILLSLFLLWLGRRCAE